jgi:hypothetical protein
VFAHARNEVIAVLTRIWESHLMPPAGALKTLDRRRVVCIHSPAEHLWWTIDVDEIDPHFTHLERTTVNHWDKSTRAEQTARLEMLRSTERLNPIPVIAKTPSAPSADSAAPDAGVEEPRRPGQFHKPRTKRGHP